MEYINMLKCQLVLLLRLLRVLCPLKIACILVAASSVLDLLHLRWKKIISGQVSHIVYRVVHMA